MRRYTSEVPLFAGFLRTLSLLAVLMITACGGGSGGGGVTPEPPSPPASPPPPPPAPPASLAVADYTVISLAGGRGGDEGALAYDINNHGQIVGAIDPTFFRGTAVLWTISGSEVLSTQNLGTLPGGSDSHAKAINDVGQIVGWSSDGSTRRPFVWTAGSGMVDLGIPPSFPAAIANDINDSGQVVGAIFPSVDGTWDPWFSSRFMVWTVDQNGNPIAELDLGTFGGENAAAFGNNSLGYIAGASYRDDSEGFRGVGLVWAEPNSEVELDGFTEVFAINDFGEVAGNYDTLDRGFFWSSDDGFVDIPEGIPSDLNNSRQIVGTTVIGSPSAFIWHDGETRALPPPPATEIGWQSYHATAINEDGWVAGYSAPDWQAILWIPNSP
jgi:probable HAF family extracellular repeat protein